MWDDMARNEGEKAGIRQEKKGKPDLLFGLTLLHQF